MLRIALVTLPLTTLVACSGEVLFASSAGQGGAGGSGDVTASSSSSATGVGGAGGAEVAACETFCGALDESCPDGDACIGPCLQLFGSVCATQVIDFLACVPSWVQPGCIIGYPDVGAGCSSPIGAFDSCMTEAFVPGCNSGSTLGEGNSCTGTTQCGGEKFSVSCDVTAKCTCQKNGVFVGECQNPLKTLELCKPVTSCCREMLLGP